MSDTPRSESAAEDEPVGSGIERRCLVRRESSDRDDLVRLVAGPDGLVYVDYRMRLPGRGAYVTPERAAIELLEKKLGLLQKALGAPVRTDGLLARVVEANQKAVMDALSLAARSGTLVGGKDGVRDLLTNPSTLAVVVASDASPRLVQDLRSRMGDRPLFELALSCDALGAQIGKGARAALAVRPTAPGRSLVRELRRMDRLR